MLRKINRQFSILNFFRLTQYIPPPTPINRNVTAVPMIIPTQCVFLSSIFILPPIFLYKYKSAIKLMPKPNKIP